MNSGHFFQTGFARRLWVPLGVFSLQYAAIAQNNEAPGNPVVTEAVPPTMQVLSPERIVCESLPYNDRGVSMVPLRPVCDYLKATTTYQDGLLTLVKNFEDAAIRTVTLRLGGNSAQVWDGGAPRTVALPRPTEARLGVIFVPAKFLVEILGGQLETNARKVPSSVFEGTRQGVFVANGQQKYSQADAVRIILTNRVGKAMSLRLNGPQKLRIEIGQGATEYLQLKPGVYYFQASSAGMQTINGARRFLAGRKTSWAWGRQK